jgi:fluoroacetyl-CoA thioesterase
MNDSMNHNKLTIGTRAELTRAVESRWCTQRGQHLIFSTPSMVQLAERAAMEALAPVLGPGQISVGTFVEIRHLAPTPEGMSVRAIAEVTEIEGARVAFKIEIFDDLAKVGEASHQRFILDMERYVRRLEKKKAEFAASKATWQEEENREDREARDGRPGRE